MKLLYLDAAVSEFDEAITYYNTQSAGLGFEFADEIKEALERIQNYPEAWTDEAGAALPSAPFSLQCYLPGTPPSLDHRRHSQQ